MTALFAALTVPHKAMTRRARAHGAILILVLVYLFLLALVSASVMHSAALHVRMAGNEQVAAAARARARAVANLLAEEPANFDAGVAVGAARCVTADAAPGCVTGGLAVLPAAFAGATIDYRVVRRAPLELSAVSLGIGVDPGQRFALFEVQVQVGQSAPASEVMRGVLLGLTPGTHAGEVYSAYWRFPATDPL